VSVAVFAGTFDPFTNGHLDIVERADRIFDAVYILVSNNSSKTPTFTRNIRAELIKKSVSHLPRVNVAISSERLLVEDIKLLRATVNIRGIRNAEDMNYESKMDDINRILDPNIETMYMKALPEVAHISSSAYNEILKLSGKGSWMVDEHTHEFYSNYYHGEQ